VNRGLETTLLALALVILTALILIFAPDKHKEWMAAIPIVIGAVRLLFAYGVTKDTTRVGSFFLVAALGITLILGGCIGTSKFEAETEQIAYVIDESGNEVEQRIPVKIKGEGVHAPHIYANEWGLHITPEPSSDTQITAEEGLLITGDRTAAGIAIMMKKGGDVAITYGSDKLVTIGEASYDPVTGAFTLTNLGADPTAKFQTLMEIALAHYDQAEHATGAQKEAMIAMGDMLTKVAKAYLTAGISELAPNETVVQPPIESIP